MGNKLLILVIERFAQVNGWLNYVTFDVISVMQIKNYQLLFIKHQKYLYCSGAIETQNKYIKNSILVTYFTKWVEWKRQDNGDLVVWWLVHLILKQKVNSSRLTLNLWLK